ncbi:MAG TPA: DUF2889 domain-containing protein [Acetobacteraceae bacterium]|nr:DUF2889 domain-containing protein [Acetobacteraceae bacterium]
MPLSAPADRELLHSRDIILRGYRRADGLYDIEAQLTDSKTYASTNHDRGIIEAGEPIHGMWLRLTVDEKRHIVAAEAASDHTPYTVCPGAAPNFARLAGLQIKPGFLKEAAKRVGGTVGCTHLRELLQQMATTAYQTIDPARAKREAEAAGERDEPGSDRLDMRITMKMGGAPAILNTCIAYGSDSPVVRRRWPHLYTGPSASD